MKIHSLIYPAFQIILFVFFLPGNVIPVPHEKNEGRSELKESSSLDPQSYPDIYRISCIKERNGCPCYGKPSAQSEEIEKVHHMQPVYNPGPVNRGFQKIKISLPYQNPDYTPDESGKQECWIESKRLKKMKYSPILHSSQQDRNHEIVPLNKFVANLSRSANPQKVLPEKRKHPLGLYWATYYHMAVEDFHPGPKSPILSPEGDKLGMASREFLRQVVWEGSGVTKEGKILQYAGVRWKYRFLNNIRWSYGAGYGYRIFPYRTVAVNFPGLCRRLGEAIEDCNKEKSIGIMLFIPEVAERNIPMKDGEFHDGYFCATDTGSPYYIREDRIDIFVGTHGGGNPYLPPERRKNLLISGGIRPIVPYDWKLWDSEKKRVWCEQNKIPKDPYHPQKGECTMDYHTTAADRALHLYALFNDDGTPVRCKKNPF